MRLEQARPSRSLGMTDTVTIPATHDRRQRSSSLNDRQGRSAPLSLTTIVLTYNEEIHIERCLGNVTDWAERLIVVDSFSTDRTIEIARQLGAEVYQRPFKHQAEQFQWALDNCKIAT